MTRSSSTSRGRTWHGIKYTMDSCLYGIPTAHWGCRFAFNWQSATFSVPMLFAYMVPLRFAYTIQAIVTLAIAGTGVYVLGRVLRLGVIGCVLCRDRLRTQRSLYGVVWLAAGRRVLWLGWLFAAALMVVRGGRRAPNIAFFASRVRLCDLRGLSRRSCSTRPDARGVLVCLVGVAGTASRRFWPHPATRVDLALGAIAGAARRSVGTTRGYNSHLDQAGPHLRPYPDSTWRCRCTTP